jgi:D-alanyl-lipoteichoic acid acyltransferase DltB (MBOAT superfamily)
MTIVFKQFVRIYKIFLLAINLVFYSYWNISFTYLLVTGIGINYGLNLLIWREHRRISEAKALEIQPKATFLPKLYLTIGLFANLVILAVCKYHSFFVDSLLAVMNSFNLQLDTELIRITAPIGISFYTFRQIAHLVDSYKGKISQTSLIDFANYVSFFPQIASGPISRPQEFYADLNSSKKYSYSISEVGLTITSGILKKYVISSYLFTVVARPFSVPTSYNSLELLVALLGYACLIFVDFSGYSDLANGVTMLLGFRPIPNFNQPYSASSLSEFWSRWHISLSNWLRDYLYIPLGGSRVVWYRKYFNLFMTMLLGGIWHGVGWNFIAWGAIHGIGLWFSHYLHWLWCDLKGWQMAIVRALGIVVTFIFVCLTWVLFNCSTIEVAGQYIGQMFSFTSMNDLGEQGGGGVISWLTLAVIGGVLGWQFINKGYVLYLQKILDQYLTIATLVIGIAIYICLRLGPETVPPFIYFNF